MKKRLPVVLTLTLLTLAQLAHIQIKFLPAALMGLVAESSGLSITAVGMVISACTVASGLSPLAASLVIDRFGGTAAMAASALLTALAGLLPNLSESFPVLMAAYILCGAGIGFSFCATPVLIARWISPDFRTLALSVSFALYSAFTSLAYFLPGYMVSASGNWRAPLPAWALVSLVCAAGLAALCRAEPKSAPRAPAGPSGAAGLGRAARVPSVLVLTLVMTCFIWVNNTYSTYLPNFLERVRAADVHQSGFITSMSFLCGIFGCLLSGALETRCHRLMLYGFPVLALLGGVGLGLSSRFWVLALCSGLFGFAYQGWIPQAYAIFMRDPRMDAGTLGGAAALFDGVGHILTLLIPAAYAGLIAAAGMARVMLITSAGLLLPFALQLAFRRALSPVPAGPDASAERD